jgi:hypothetical protein
MTLLPSRLTETMQGAAVGEVHHPSPAVAGGRGIALDGAAASAVTSSAPAAVMVNLVASRSFIPPLNIVMINR